LSGSAHRADVLERAVAVAGHDVLVRRELGIGRRVQTPLELSEDDAEQPGFRSWRAHGDDSAAITPAFPGFSSSWLPESV